ncbi:hypothetical protein [Arthrobacter sp. NEB 688]|uniref:hypothetical protein n=1 Tax=Arthrobacter sp. NEB 688 TaxID=904039 RepID=UPI0015634326|nr:hypothetical protein [Arthrobacter sp. NEB 688]QKE85248.1 hypothetical protein HL663_15740 [Arthrobacter sp. NEB 688]
MTTRAARLLLGCAVRLLPVASRWRYADELDAELFAMPARRRLGYAVSVLAGAPRLRWELVAVRCGGRASARCWAGVHHDRTLHPNREEPMIIALECVRCGRVRDPRQYLPRTQRLDNVVWGSYYLDGNR